MEYPIRISTLTKAVKFYKEVVEMNLVASAYIQGFQWCKEVKESVLYLNLGSTLCIFLLEIENSSSTEDNFLWIMVGDIPSMYLDVYGPKTTIQVIEDYVFLAKQWISKVESGLSVANCYPFEAAPTLEMAEMLKKRIKFYEEKLIPNIDEIPLPPTLMAL